jgi:chemotaxis protein MotB
MSSPKDVPAEEIIIVRRRHSEDDHHHGGVWKIAYADFMTAMMAFFLVMWLINASNTETKASVASYFNPIKLTDTVSRRKGVVDVDEKSNANKASKGDGHSKEKENGSAGPDAGKGSGKDKGDKSKAAKETPAAGGAAERRQRLAMAKENAAANGKSGESVSGASTANEAGSAFRDPFNPLTSSRQVGMEDTARPAVPSLKPPPPAASPAAVGPAVAGPAVAASPGTVPPASYPPPAPSPSASSQTPASPAAAESAKGVTETAGRKDEENLARLTAAAANIMKEAEAVVRRLGITGGPGIDVRVEEDSIVVSLTDTATFGMFSVGSADPNDLVVRLVQSLTPLLAANSDRIVIRGHTDSRPYRGSDTRNNNWRLAMSRAEAAYAMLLRSGIEETRFERIEAHADRKPKIASDTEAAANRRIEILLRRSTR